MEPLTNCILVIFKQKDILYYDRGNTKKPGKLLVTMHYIHIHTVLPSTCRFNTDSCIDYFPPPLITYN